ncbi:MAG: arylamine N-acetyltransferase [Gammaproteobacteria bacterium]|nr:arylamine N-acetyltransferase [Gammaproteobacteria bacterium]
MTTGFDLDAYLGRIGYAGDRAPTLQTLRAIHVCHPQSIAFENLNCLLRWEIPLDVDSLQRKLVRDGRGGYCYEQNLLFSHALRVLGFKVTCLAARVMWNMSAGTVRARSHMLLRVDLDDAPYIADVGFGGLTLTGPLRLAPDIEQATPHELFRLISAGEEFVVQARIREQWRALYRFDLQEQSLPDYEVSNWYLSNHPDSKFVKELIAARPAPDRRYALLNNDLSVHYLDGTTERRILRSAPELREALQNEFQLKLPETGELETVLERFAPAGRG